MTPSTLRGEPERQSNEPADATRVGAGKPRQNGLVRKGERVPMSG